MAIFEPLEPNAVKDMARRADCGSRSYSSSCKLAVDYLEGRQLDDTLRELTNRFPATQGTEQGQQIAPVTLPLTERYVDEAASLYSKPVKRKLVDAVTGETNEATERQTDALAKMLDDARYDEIMHRNEQLSVLLLTSCIYYGAKNGKLSATIKMPYDVSTVQPTKAAMLDQCDPDDYDAFIVEAHGGTYGVNAEKSQKTFVFLTNAEVQFWTGSAPNELRTLLSRFDNPYEWMQTVDGAEKLAPGRMLTFWHKRYPLECLITKGDPAIVAVNRELNIAWSSLLDTIKIQGASVPVLTLNSKSDIKGRRRYGSRWPIVLRADESFELASAAQSYTEQVDVLRQFVQVMATLSRQSANEYAINGTTAASGFAKLVDSLPKIEAREERIRRCTSMEQQEAWPRLRAIGQQLGLLDSSTDSLAMRVEYSDMEFPLSEQERAQKIDTDIKYNLTTPSHIMAKERGMPESEADEEVAENKAENDANAPAMPQQSTQLQPLGGLVGRRSATEQPRQAPTPMRVVR